MADKFEGDIDLTPEQVAGMRNGLISQTKRWKNKKVDYVISGNFCNFIFMISILNYAVFLTSDYLLAKEQKNYIRKGLNTLELATCLKFIEHEYVTGLTDFVDVVVSITI